MHASISSAGGFIAAILCSGAVLAAVAPRPWRPPGTFLHERWSFDTGG
jgi:hypothetical protein